MNFKSTLILILVASLYSCSPQLSAVWQKPDYNGEKYDKLVVVAITNNLENREIAEDAMVKQFRIKGITAYRGRDYFTPDMNVNLQSKESLRKVIDDNSIDGVITISLIDESEIKQYVQGETYVVPDYYYPYGYYTYQRYSTVSTPGYFVTSKKYVVEGVLHDLKNDGAEDRLVWRGQSSLINPSSIKSASTEFSQAMVNYLVKNGLVERP